MLRAIASRNNELFLLESATCARAYFSQGKCYGPGYLGAPHLDVDRKGNIAELEGFGKELSKNRKNSRKKREDS